MSPPPPHPRPQQSDPPLNKVLALLHIYCTKFFLKIRKDHSCEFHFQELTTQVDNIEGSELGQLGLGHVGNSGSLCLSLLVFSEPLDVGSCPLLLCSDQ